LVVSSVKNMTRLESSLPDGDLVVVEVPARLERAMQEMRERLKDESHQTAVLERELTEFFRDDWPGDVKRTHPHSALRIAAICATLSRPIQEVKALAIYAANKAQALGEDGNWIESLALLIEGVQLTHNSIPQADAHQARILVRHLSDLIAQTFHTCAIVGSLEDVGRISDLKDVFKIAKAVWQPNLHASLDVIIRLVQDLPKVLDNSSTDGGSGKALTRLTGEITRVRGSIEDLRERSHGPVRHQATLMLELLEAWYEMAQRQIVLLAQVDRVKPPEDERRELESRVEDQIGQVERELRALIAQRYAERYGKDWIDRVQKQHERMYLNWIRILKKDRAAFQAYQEYAPSILEYAHLGDLTVLITGEWDLFREFLDFGYDRRNKAVFQDKMEHIIKVRNPLAHHRAIPENEILRALVLCTDILKAVEILC
jgi:hypothetical protein